MKTRFLLILMPSSGYDDCVPYRVVIAFVPNVVLALIGIFAAVKFDLKGCYQVAKHPLVIIMAIYTPFIHSSFDWRAKTRQTRHLALSYHFTFMNILLIIAQTVYFEHLDFNNHLEINEHDVRRYTFYMITQLGTVLTFFKCMQARFKVIVIADPEGEYFITENGEIEKEVTNEKEEKQLEYVNTHDIVTQSLIRK